MTTIRLYDANEKLIGDFEVPIDANMVHWRGRHFLWHYDDDFGGSISIYQEEPINYQATISDDQEPA